jgi:F-type H+-transporting ATPase subunit alpha
MIPTGIKALDMFCPFSRGTRIALVSPRCACTRSTPPWMLSGPVAHRSGGKTALALHMVSNFARLPADERPIVVYCVIGQSQTQLDRVSATLVRSISAARMRSPPFLLLSPRWQAASGALAFTTVIAATDATTHALQYFAAHVAAGTAAGWRDQGRHVVAVFDDLSAHAVAYQRLAK